ncbi:hypothetical protein [Undibacterium sp.]|jgi:hypothetical protein|uniref:hypothetical protein n=1 Tax=Undibacterium sp. TaxID=1914977 RepID=UPI002B7D34F7|nr:hypothetical protein [Undibacterium sp.]HTD05873.1 hypothetical protein [Undibacterium sp.]
MATRKPKAQSPMSVVSVDFEDYFLPADQGMQLVRIMQNAVKCRSTFQGGGVNFLTAEQPKLELKIVTPAQVRPATSESEFLSAF